MGNYNYAEITLKTDYSINSIKCTIPQIKGEWHLVTEMH